MNNKTTKLIAAASFVAAASSLPAQVLVTGWDFTDTNPLADPAVYAADVAGGLVSASLDTSAFQQPNTPGGGGVAIDFNAQYVGFGDVGSIPDAGDFDANNGFSSDAFDIYFQGPIDGLAWAISLDVSSLESVQLQFDSFSTNTTLQSGGVLSYNIGGGSSTDWDTGDANVSFAAGAYNASDLYSLDVSGVNTLDITFTFDSSETAQFNLTERAYFDNIAIGGTVVPEPSTYAAIAGALALGFVAYRRRK